MDAATFAVPGGVGGIKVDDGSRGLIASRAFAATASAKRLPLAGLKIRVRVPVESSSGEDRGAEEEEAKERRLRRAPWRQALKPKEDKPQSGKKRGTKGQQGRGYRSENSEKRRDL